MEELSAIDTDVLFCQLLSFWCLNKFLLFRIKNTSHKKLGTSETNRWVTAAPAKNIIDLGVKFQFFQQYARYIALTDANPYHNEYDMAPRGKGSSIRVLPYSIKLLIGCKEVMIKSLDFLECKNCPGHNLFI